MLPYTESIRTNHGDKMAKKTPAKLRKGNKTLWIGALLALLIVIVASFAFYFSSNSYEQMKMARYLEHKYNDQFVVKDIEKEGSTIGISGRLVAVAYPKDENNLTFKVYNENDKLSDTYMSVVWSKQAYARDTAPIERIVSNSEVSFLEIKVASSFKSQQENLIKPDELNLAKAIERHGTSLNYYLHMEQVNKKSVQENISLIYDLIEYIRGTGINSIAISYSFSDNISRHRCGLTDSEVKQITDRASDVLANSCKREN